MITCLCDGGEADDCANPLYYEMALADEQFHSLLEVSVAGFASEGPSHSFDRGVISSSLA